MDEILNIYFEEYFEDIISETSSEYAESDVSSDSRIFVPRRRIRRLSDSDCQNIM